MLGAFSARLLVFRARAGALGRFEDALRWGRWCDVGLAFVAGAWGAPFSWFFRSHRFFKRARA